mmetsp:Transcript_14923/g.28470  ORF Transcript_14923/g.28470 Transcript_14923/m.28470 type:complete len:393 (-) Transcript_14923:204-1382(-)
MHRGQDRNRLLRHIHSRKNSSRLANARQPLLQKIRWQMIQMQINMILLGSHSPPLPNLHGHGPRHDVSTGQVLGAGGIPLHEPLPLRIPQDASLSATPLRDEAPSAVNPRGVELHELGVLVGQPRPHGHGVPVPGARVGRRAGEVGAAVPPRRQDGVLGEDAVQGAVLHVEGHGPDALSVVRHEEVHGEVLDEVGGVEGQAAAVEGVQHGVAGAIGGAGAAVGLAPLAVLQALPAEGPLVDLPLLGPAEGQAELLQLQDGLGRLPAHVVNGVLVAQPVAALDGVVHVPPPVVGAHVAQRGVDAPLGGDGVRAGGEEFGEAGGAEARFGEAHGRAEAGAAGADDEGVVRVVYYGVVAAGGGGCGGGEGERQRAGETGKDGRRRLQGGASGPTG